MRIHSSSLTLTPAGFNRAQIGKQGGAQNKDEKKEPSVPTGSPDDWPHHLPLYKAEAIRQTLNISGQNLITTNKKHDIPPRDTRALRALAAYSEELNKSLPDQHARITRVIDFFA